MCPPKEPEGYKNSISGVTLPNTGEPRRGVLEFQHVRAVAHKSLRCCLSSTWSFAQSCDSSSGACGLEMPRHSRSWSCATSSKSSNVRSAAPASSPTTASCSPPPAGWSPEFDGMPSRCAPRPCCAGTGSSSRAKQRDGEGGAANVPYPAGPQSPDRPLREGQPALGLRAHSGRAQKMHPSRCSSRLTAE
jgi:hypothetical protein